MAKRQAERSKPKRQRPWRASRPASTRRLSHRPLDIDGLEARAVRRGQWWPGFHDY
ncbi:MAG TPA: hypothetical protein VF491_17425 [Vicinamibacterales bacterium]